MFINKDVYVSDILANTLKGTSTFIVSLLFL